TPGVHATMWIALLVNATAYPVTNGLLPHVAKNIYGTDETGLGYLAASFAAGALVGSMVLMLAGSRMRLARVMIVSSAGWDGVVAVVAPPGGPIRRGPPPLPPGVPPSARRGHPPSPPVPRA